MKKMKIAIVIVVLALALLISGVGCRKAAETTTQQDAEQLENDIDEMDKASQAIDELDLDFNETELEQIEDLF